VADRDFGEDVVSTRFAGGEHNGWRRMVWRKPVVGDTYEFVLTGEVYYWTGEVWLYHHNANEEATFKEE
jgi:hypothetical protein